MQNDPEKRREEREGFESGSENGYERREEAPVEHKEERIEQEPAFEEKEAVREHLERKAEEMEVTPEIKEDITAHVSSARFSEDDEATVQRLLQVVQTKGVRFAIKVAQEMNNPYVLDLLHDALAKNNMYKQYID